MKDYSLDGIKGINVGTKRPKRLLGEQFHMETEISTQPQSMADNTQFQIINTPSEKRRSSTISSILAKRKKYEIFSLKTQSRAYCTRKSQKIGYFRYSKTKSN